MSKTQRQLVYEAVLPYAQDNFKKITVKAGRYDGSQKCHHISRQILEDGNADNVSVTLSFLPNSGVNVHFINKINGEYVDHTLGYLSKKNNYYLISEHKLAELKKIDVHMLKMLINIKKDILNKVFNAEELKKYKIDTSHI